MRRLLLGLALGLLAHGAMAEPVAPLANSPCRAGAQVFAEVDLYFGGAVRRRQWDSFVTHVVTPRFPLGFTVLDGQGQWRGRNGLTRERSRLMIILYAADRASDGKIEYIRTAYKTRFRQKSVLRVDRPACVSF